MRTHADSIQHQFDPQAHAYLESAVHARGADLDRAAVLVRAALPLTAQVLDVGCGAGHLSFSLAGSVGSVTAVDPSPSMLSTVREAAAARGLADRIATVQAPAESLPFPDARFCLVATRYSAHHWLDLAAALREMRRVVKPGGYLLVIDSLGDDSSLVDTHLQAMELLRDPSHVRNRTVVQWLEAITGAGFVPLAEETTRVQLDYAAWVERMRTPVETRAAIRSLQVGAPRQVHDALAIEADGSFTLRNGLFWAQAATN
jgi:ubiquinone/menaquinone biosynthesis C-methylase UbiE